MKYLPFLFDCSTTSMYLLMQIYIQHTRKHVELDAISTNHCHLFHYVADVAYNMIDKDFISGRTYCFIYQLYHKFNVICLLNDRDESNSASSIPYKNYYSLFNECRK